MPDDKRGREKQARDEDRRQRERDVAEARERGDEPEPPEEEPLGDLEAALDEQDFPLTPAEIIAEYGDREVAVDGTRKPVEEVFPDTDEEAYESPEAVRERIEKPTVGAAMGRIMEASREILDKDRLGSQRDAYRKTLESLKAIDADDDDEGVTAITDWIVEEIQRKEKRPSSRRVRRQAAKFCRENGYEIRDDEWLGA